MAVADKQGIALVDDAAHQGVGQPEAFSNELGAHKSKAKATVAVPPR